MMKVLFVVVGMVWGFSYLSFSQINYSCDMNANSGGCGLDWDNNGFSYTSNLNGNTNCGGGSNYFIYDNVYSGDSKTTTWNATQITGHTGGQITVTVKARLRKYASPNGDMTSTEWGSMKIYYKTSLPTEAAPGTQIGSTINSSTYCQFHSVYFTPGEFITNLYIAI